jgi:hypothetical protein
MSRSSTPTGRAVRRHHRERPGEHPVSLRVAAEHKRLLAHAREPVFAVEGHRPRVLFPSSEPQGLRAPRARSVEGGVHEHLGDAVPMPRACDVEALELQGRWPLHGCGRRSRHQLHLAHQLRLTGRAPAMGEQHGAGEVGASRWTRSSKPTNQRCGSYTPRASQSHQTLKASGLRSSIAAQVSFRISRLEELSASSHSCGRRPTPACSRSAATIMNRRG